jgi:tRNA-specific 2-thiouridylase
MPRRVVVAMSGGVDSSVAAWLLKQEGYDVVGIFLRTGVSVVPRNDGRHRGCCSAVDARDARQVADQLDFPCYSLDFADDFRQIMDYFAQEYVRGRTPNPCVVCNSQIKFGKLWHLAQALDADFLATGHYAQVVQREKNWALRQAQDTRKDQTYVLFGIEAALLPRLLFPIGHLTKAEVRALAQKAGLPVAEKAESQDICFVPDGDSAGFVQRQRPDALSSGVILDTHGRVLGQHAGINHFTIGQRKGLGLPRETLRGQRRFVLDIIPSESKVVLGTAEECLTHGIHAERCNWFLPVAAGQLCNIKWSHRGKPVPGRIETISAERVSLRFAEPQLGIAPGQAVVIYQEDVMLGGGWVAGTWAASDTLTRKMSEPITTTLA